MFLYSIQGVLLAQGLGSSVDIDACKSLGKIIASLYIFSLNIDSKSTRPFEVSLDSEAYSCYPICLDTYSSTLTCDRDNHIVIFAIQSLKYDRNSAWLNLNYFQMKQLLLNIRENIIILLNELNQRNERSLEASNPSTILHRVDQLDEDRVISELCPQLLDLQVVSSFLDDSFQSSQLYLRTIISQIWCL